MEEKREVWGDSKLLGLSTWREGEPLAEMGKTVGGRDLGQKLGGYFEHGRCLSS